MSVCRGCGAPANPANPPLDRCEACPPRVCPDCGYPDSFAAPCPCWVTVDGLPLADVKALLALGDLSVTVPA